MKIIVYEYICGGGYAGQPLPNAVLAEGYGMLRGVVEDFAAVGHEVTVLLDGRLSKLNPPLAADYTVPVRYKDEATRFLPELLKINDAAYIIAPETDGILQSLVALMEKTNKISLNSTAEAIASVANKPLLYKTLQLLNVLPPTSVLDLAEGLAAFEAAAERLGYPVVVKPADGVSCAGISVVTNKAEVEFALKKISVLSKNRQVILQSYIEGEAASVSLLSNGKTTLPLSLNKQNLTLKGPKEASSYLGGMVPFEHPQKEAAFTAAKRVVDAFGGLRGYVGVDVILSGERVFVVDVNARLTTSYVGLRKVAGFNVGAALVDAVLERKMPQRAGTKGAACFTKVQTVTPASQVYEEAVKSKGVVSPPFPLEGDGEACGLVLGEGATPEVAAASLEEAKKHLCTLVC